jgi:hypothetical protein
MNYANQENFINHELDAWANRVTDAVIRALKRERIGITQELRDSVKARAKQNIGELLFLQYGRFVDMGAGKGSRRGVESIASNRSMLTGRRPKKFYSKTAYGTLSSLIQALVSNYREHIVYQAKNQLP